MPKIETQWQRFDVLSVDQLYELLRFRQNIFVVEQRSPYPDLDGLDQGAWHLLLRLDRRLSGYLRLIPTPGPPLPVRVGRVAVASQLRHRGLGRILMEEALRRHRERYAAGPLILSAQTQFEPFYRGFGFVATGSAYEDYGVAHVDMMLD